MTRGEMRKTRKREKAEDDTEKMENGGNQENK